MASLRASGIYNPIGVNSHLHSRRRPDVMMGDCAPPRKLGKYVPVLHDEVVKVLLLEPPGSRVGLALPCFLGNVQDAAGPLSVQQLER